MVSATERVPRRRVSHLEMIWMNIFWFANNVHWGALLAVVIPSQVAKFSANKAAGLPMVTVAGTIIAVLVHPLAGALSDRITSRWGKRRPYLFWWTLPNIVGLIAMAYAREIWVMALIFALIQLANNMANAPWTAVIADKVPKEQRGVASGYYGLMGVLGTVVGGGVLAFMVDKTAPEAVYIRQLFLVYGIVVVIQTACTVLSVLFVKEEPAPGGPRLSRREIKDLFWINPKQYPDFFWVYLTRFLVTLGIWVIYTFLQYYFEDVLGMKGEASIGNFLIWMTASSVLTVYLAGYLSDFWGRKGMVYLSGGIMTLVCLGFLLLQQPWILYPAAVLFGLGYGAYQSVDNALAVDVLPDPEEFGKHMGVWQVAGILPQVLASLVGGVVLSATRGAAGHLGYTLIFVAAVLFFLLGTVFVARVKSVR